MNFGQNMNFQKLTTITWRELVGLDSRMFLDANIIQKTVRVGNQKGVKGVSCRQKNKLTLKFILDDLE